MTWRCALYEKILKILSEVGSYWFCRLYGIWHFLFDTAVKGIRASPLFLVVLLRDNLE